MRIAGLLLLLLACLPPHLLSKLLFGSSSWPRRFLGAAGWIAGARVTVVGNPVEPHSLLIVNHISWLDILVLGGAAGCAFVSKDALGPALIHWLADQNHTVYIRRSNRRESKDQVLAIAAALIGGRPVALFPEGTVGPGDHLLPFRSTLLEAAASAGKDVIIRPVALAYAAATEISWHGESARDNALRILGRRGTVPITVHLLNPLSSGLDRKQLASQAQAAIGEALASSPHASRL